MTFGENVKKIRESKGLSQRILGEKMNVTQQTIAQYEKLTDLPKIATVRRIADALEVDISELYDNPMKQTAREVARDHIVKTTETINAAINKRIESYSPDEEREYLLSNYDSVNDEGKQKIVEYSEDIASNEKYQRAKEKTDE